MEDYPSNAIKPKDGVPEKKIEKIAEAVIKKKKPSFTDTFISEDVVKVKNYVLVDVIIPMIKKAIYDGVTGSLKMTLFGGSGSGDRGSNPSKISYRSYYETAKDSRPAETRRPSTVSQYDDVVIENRDMAEGVLKSMKEIIYTYGEVSIADFYDLIGIQGEHPSNKYGWTNLWNAEVLPVVDGYVIKFPRARPLG